MGASPAIFDLEKLDYYNGYYIRQKPLKELAEICRPYLEKVGHKINDAKRLEGFVGLAQDRMKKLEDIAELTEFLFGITHFDENLLCWKSLSLAEVKLNLRALAFELEKIQEEDWTKENLETIIFGWIKSNDKKNGDYLWPLRVSLTGLKNSPGPFEVAAVLGKKESLHRLEKALK